MFKRLAPYRCFLVFCVSVSSLIHAGDQKCNDPGSQYPGQTPPGNTPVVFAPASVNHLAHSGPTFSPDGKYLFFTRWLGPPPHHHDMYWMSAAIIEELRRSSLGNQLEQK